MNVEMVTLSPELLMFMAAGALVWCCITWFFLPRSRRKVEAARGSGVARSASRLMVWRSLRTIALAAFLAPLTVILLYLLAQWRIESNSTDPAKIQTLIDTRDALERVVGPLTDTALEVWIAALVAISLIWIAARMSVSSRRWKRALNARRKAQAALLATMSDQELLELAQETDAEGLQQLLDKVRALEVLNRQQIEGVGQAKVLSLPQAEGEEVAASIEDVRQLIAELEREAATIEAAEPDERSQTQPLLQAMAGS